jgi:hypothetical protein
MRAVFLASALTAGVMWLAFGGAPAHSQADDKAVSCQTCAQGSDCPHCATGKTCPHCKQGKACAHCGKSKSDSGCHGKWGSHKSEYKCVRPNKKPEAMTKQFSGLGAEGWRLVQADGGVWCFSRVRGAE